MPIPFIHPATILFAGPSMCGKTQLLLKILLARQIFPWPNRIVFVYDEWQDAYSQIKNNLPHTQFIKGPISQELYESFHPDSRNLLILDDQMVSASNSPELTKFFVQGAHHRNLTVIFLLQNIFEKGKSMRTTNLNTNYLVLFKNPRDKLQTSTLARQMFPSKAKAFLRAFEDSTTKPHGYLLVDLRQDTPDEYRIRTNILDETLPTSTIGTDLYII